MDHLAIKAHWPTEGHSAEDEISLTVRADYRNQPEEMHAFVVRQHQLLPTFISCEYFQSRLKILAGNERWQQLVLPHNEGMHFLRLVPIIGTDR